MSCREAVPNIEQGCQKNYVGGVTEIDIYTRNAAGVLTNPGNITVRVTTSGATDTTYTIADVQLVQVATGHFRLLHTNTEALKHKVTATTTGQVYVKPGFYRVYQP